jgi:hypothetical protein
MKRILLLLFTVVSIDMAYAQDQPKTSSATDIKKMADNKKFKFNAKVAVLTVEGAPANSAISSVTQDNRIELVDPFSASVTPDSVTSYLPYYDKTKTEVVATDSQSVREADPTRSSSTINDYAVKQNKKQHVIVTVKPKDGKITKYVFDIAPDGTGKVEVTIEDYKIINYEGTYTDL